MIDKVGLFILLLEIIRSLGVVLFPVGGRGLHLLFEAESCNEVLKIIKLSVLVLAAKSSLIDAQILLILHMLFLMRDRHNSYCLHMPWFDAGSSLDVDVGFLLKELIFEFLHYAFLL